MAIGDEVHRPAGAAVAAVRAAARDELLAAEAHRATAAVARGDVDVYFVDEHRISRQSSVVNRYAPQLASDRQCDSRRVDGR